MKTTIRLLIIIVFIATLLLPILKTTLDPYKGKLNYELRELATLPKIPYTFKDVVSYPNDFENYWKDNFGFRQSLVRNYTLLRYDLGMGLRDKVMIGKNDWLYASDNNSLQTARNSPLFSREELESWRLYLVSQARKSKRLGVPYVFVIVPNKATIYPEHLPRNVDRGDISRIDQLTEYMAKHSPEINIIDLRPTLLEAKKHIQVFTKTDTHWNLAGAYYSYLEIVKWLNKNGADVTAEQFAVEDFIYSSEKEFRTAGIIYYAGLRWMLGIGAEEKYSELQPLLAPLAKRCAVPGLIDPGKWFGVKTTPHYLGCHADLCHKGKYRLLMFRDSFATLLDPFISELFAYSAYIYGTPNQEMFDHYSSEAKPDFIIEQIVERFLSNVPEQTSHYDALSELKK